MGWRPCNFNLVSLDDRSLFKCILEDSRHKPALSKIHVLFVSTELRDIAPLRNERDYLLVNDLPRDTVHGAMEASLTIINYIKDGHREINYAVAPARLATTKDKWTTRYFNAIFKDLNLLSTILGAVRSVGEELVIDCHNLICAILLECLTLAGVRPRRAGWVAIVFNVLGRPLHVRPVTS
jgi:hypothetical protein